MWQKILEFFTKKKKKKKKKLVSVSASALEENSSIMLIQTPVQNLMIGMYVAELDIPWLESPFMFQGFLVETEKELEKLRKTCQYVYVDSSKQKKRKINTNTKIKSNQLGGQALIFGKPPKRLGTFEKEILRAELNYKDTGILVCGFMDKIVSDGSIDAKLAKEAVSTCVNSILHSPDAFLWLSQLKHKDQYTAQHSLNVCVLSIVLGRHIGLNELHLNQVGLCGMMHDMGKMLVPLEVLNKPAILEEDELEIMRSHTTLGYELLKSSDDMFYGAVETALTHHEHLDGKGYPRKINSNNMSYYSNIVAIADMYDAITSDRVYRKGRTHHVATKAMLDVSGSHLDAELVVKFIESLGVYPPGCFVELNNGSVAIVVEQNSRFKLRPKVMMILDEDKNSIEGSVIDISEMVFDKSGSVLSIKAIINPDDYQIDSEKYYQQGVIQKGFSKNN
ncbi:MAG: HD-GYP domain-containing protein [Methylococcales bacterium]|nr:HD-GYP domain-containing protein [Methylococcales bacterium]